MSTSEVEKKVEEENQAPKGGELLFCGATCWDIVGRRKGPAEGNLVSPSRLRPLVGISIRSVASGCGNKNQYSIVIKKNNNLVVFFFSMLCCDL